MSFWTFCPPPFFSQKHDRIQLKNQLLSYFWLCNFFFTLPYIVKLWCTVWWFLFSVCPFVRLSVPGQIVMLVLHQKRMNEFFWDLAQMYSTVKYRMSTISCKIKKRFPRYALPLPLWHLALANRFFFRRKHLLYITVHMSRFRGYCGEDITDWYEIDDSQLPDCEDNT